MKTYSEITAAFKTLEDSLSDNAERFLAFYEKHNLSVFRPVSTVPIGARDLPDFSDYHLKLPNYIREGQDFEYQPWHGPLLMVPASYMEDPEAWEKEFLASKQETIELVDRLVYEFAPRIRTEMPWVKPIITEVLGGTVQVYMVDERVPTDSDDRFAARVMNTPRNCEIVKANCITIDLDIKAIHDSFMSGY